VPAEGGGAVAVNVSGAPLWRWLEATAASNAAPRTQVEKHGLTMLRDAVKQLNLLKFPTEVLPHVNGPLTVLYGTAEGTTGGARGASLGVAALVFKSDDPTAAMERLSVLSQGAVEGSGPVRWDREVHQGYSLGYLTLTEALEGYTDYKRPCVAVVNDTVVFANNLTFLKAVLDVAAGQDPALVDAEPYRAARKRLAMAGVKRLFEEGLVACGFVHGPALREGLEGYIPIWAHTEVHKDDAMRRTRQEVMAEHGKRGHAPADDVITREVLDRLEARVRATEKAIRDAVKPLEAVAYVAFEAEAKGGGMVVRLVAGLRGN
jgi:hypothetical protein